MIICRFTLKEQHLVEFNQVAMANHDGSEDMLNRVMTKDNIGLTAMLHVKPTTWGEYSYFLLPYKNRTSFFKIYNLLLMIELATLLK